jgi:ABC-type sugar transport system ATPase subunit
VLALADDVVVMRDGRVTGAGPAAGFTVPALVARMVGREMARVFPERTSRPGADAVLEVRGLTEPGVARDVSFAVRAGEVLGVFGLMGSGRTELARMVYGLDPYARGAVRVAGAALPPGDPRAAVARGLAFVTEDRRDEGLLAEAPVLDNVALASLPRFARGPLGVVDRAGLRGAVARVAGELGVRCDAVDGQPVRSLSGGNQQKVVLARWLLTPPRVLVLDEPTRGIDVGAKHEVYAIVDRLAAGGAGVLMISSEVEELVGTCDRILVMHAGEVAAAFDGPGAGGPAFDPERILRAAFGEAAAGAASRA